MEATVLRENEWSPDPLPQQLVSSLVDRFGGRFEIRPVFEGGLRVRPCHYAGSISVGDRQLLIRPKVDDLRSLFHLLEYAYHLAVPLPETVGHEESADLFEYLVRILVKQVEDIVRRGILRGYVEQEDDLTVLRGRFDLDTHFQRNLARPELIACSYDEFTPDIIENHLIARTLERLLVSRPWSPGLRDRMANLRVQLTFERRPTLGLRDFDRVRFHRLNLHYEAPLRICRLIAACRSVSESAGVVPISAFLIDMNLLFQDYVAGYLRTYLEKTSKLRLGIQIPGKLNHPGQWRDLHVWADLVLYRNEVPKALLDTKYRDIGLKGVKDSEVYQVVAYAHAYQLQKVALVYPSTDDRERHYRIKGTDIELRTFSIDLRGGPKSIEKESSGFCKRVVEWVTSYPTAVYHSH